jgi:hypothetical protein
MASHGVNQEAARMREFIDALPPTRVQVIYFDTRRNPSLREIMRRLDVGGETLYINCGPAGEWVYTYRLSEIKFLFTRLNTKVTAFIGRTHAPYSGGATFDMANIGNHLTVGIYTFNKRRWLTTHCTEYEENGDRPMEFAISHSNHCTLDLDKPIGPDALCFTNKRAPTNQTLGHVYSDAPLWLDVIQVLHEAFGQPKLGGKSKILLGTRDGMYILRGSKKIYLKRAARVTKGGARRAPLTDDIVHMMYAYVVKPVLRHYELIHVHIQSTLLYDQDNEFESDTNHIVLVYAVPEHYMCQRFYIDATKVFAAFEALQRETAGDQIAPYPLSCLQEVRGMASAHVQRLVGLAG